MADKDRKLFAADLKTIYHAPTEQKGAEALDRVTEKWNEKYPNAMKSWYKNWGKFTGNCRLCMKGDSPNSD